MIKNLIRQEQLECLHSENTPCRLMIAYTINSYRIPSHNKTMSKLQILKICPKFKFLNFANKFTYNTPFEVAW